MPTPRRQSTVRMNLEALYDRLLPSAIAGHVVLPDGYASGQVRLVDSQNKVLDQQTVTADGYYLLADTDDGVGACRVEMLTPCTTDWAAANGTSTTIATNRTGNVSQAAAAIGKITGQLSIQYATGTMISASASDVGVAVQATGPNGVVRVAMPDSSGAYTFSDLPVGAYTVTAIRLDSTNDGIAGSSTSATVAANATATADTSATVTASITVTSIEKGPDAGDVRVRIRWKNLFGDVRVNSGVYGVRNGVWDDLYQSCPPITGVSGDTGMVVVATGAYHSNQNVQIQCFVRDSANRYIAQSTCDSVTK